MIQAFYGLHAPLEARLAALPWETAGVDFDMYRRADLLASDLTHLGVSPDAVARSTNLPRTDSLAAGFGALYVLVAATLGGQVIAREAQSALDLPDDVTRFFRSDGHDIGPAWRAFGRALDGAVTTPEAFREATEAAEATFEAFGRWIGAATHPTP